MLARIYDDMLDEIKHLTREQQGLVILAFVNYEIYWIEPPKDDVLTYSIFYAKKHTIDWIIKDIKASINNWRKGWRPVKNFDNSQKPKHNLTITQEKPNDNLWETCEKPDTRYKIQDTCKEIKLDKSSFTKKEWKSNLEEYINAYNSSSLKNLIWDDEGAILEWLKYKQARKELYATPNSFLTQFKGYFNLVSPNEILPDVGKRLSFAIHTAIDNRWKWLVRDEKQKQLYEWYRKVDFSLKKKEQWIA